MNQAEQRPEQVLLTTSCMRMSGAVAQVGELILTADEIRFTPRGLDRAVGAETSVIDVLDIDEISRGRGLDSELRIRIGEITQRFGGRGAGWLALRLRALLLDPEGELEPFEVFARDEPIVICGDISVYLFGFLATRGEVILTDRRIRIRTTGGIESWFSGQRQLDCKFTEVRRVERRGVRKALSIEKDQTQIAIGGGVSPQVAAALGAVLIDAEVPGRWEQHVGLESVFEAQLKQGPRYIPGTLAVSTRALQFTPTGRIDSAAGAQDITLDLEEIYQLALIGRGDPALDVRTESGRMTLLMDESRERFDDLIGTLQTMPHEPPLGARPVEYISSVEVDCFLSGWSEQLESGEEVRSLEWVVQWPGDSMVRIGWMLVTESRVLFLPTAAEEKMPRAEIYRVEEMGRLKTAPDSPRLRFMVGDRSIAFTHARGKKFVHDFWRQCNVAMVMKSSQESRQRRTLRRLEGKSPFLRVLRKGQEVLRVDEPRLVYEDDGLSLKLIGEEAALLSKLGAGEAEIGRSEGVYSFDMRVKCAPSLDEGEFRKGRKKVLLQPLSPIRLMNRRDGFRVDVSFIVDVTFSGTLEKEAANCGIGDLSIGGVSLTVPWALPHGVVAEFELPVPGEPLKVRARLVRLIQEGGGVRRWRYAVAFYGLEDIERSRINQLVLEQQRKRLRA